MRKKILISYIVVIIIMTFFPPVKLVVSGYLDGKGDPYYPKGSVYTYQYSLLPKVTSLTGFYETVEFYGDVTGHYNVEINWTRYFLQIVIVTIVFGIIFFYSRKSNRKKLKEIFNDEKSKLNCYIF